MTTRNLKRPHSDSNPDKFSSNRPRHDPGLLASGAQTEYEEAEEVASQLYSLCLDDTGLDLSRSPSPLTPMPSEPEDDSEDDDDTVHMDKPDGQGMPNIYCLSKDD